ncbi:MAG: hypothetical protein J2P13_02505 [Acidobacteria bacterium]|nr:hypothetical protein [Acidobacteriota bacterium]
MTLLDAQQFDEARARRRRNLIIAIVLAGLVAAWLGYHLRHFPERRAADKFFSALAHQNIEGAYALWLQDPDWKQHPGKYSNYTFSDFYQDWGPASEWGRIGSHEINCSYSTASGVIVEATLNHRAERAYVWVDKSDRTLHFSPNQIECGNWFGWLTE